MLGKTRLALTTTAVLTVFVFSAMFTVPALADDSAPPPVDTPTEVAAPPADEPGTADAVPAESAAPITELVSQMPEGTQVVVTDASGNALPLASKDAANAAAVNDPIWCPDGVTPIASTAGCSTSYANLEDLVADVGGGLNPAKNGTIWIQNTATDSSTGLIAFDGGALNFATWKNFSLTLQGGWDGGSNKIIRATPSTIDHQLSITGWNGNVTLKDVVVDQITVNQPNSTIALDIETTKNILLDRVTVQNNSNSDSGVANVMGGAYLDNTAGVGTVTVNNSDFTSNEDYGLLVYSKGVVTTNNLVASLNDGTGAFIDNRLATTDKAVTLKGLKQFYNNGGDGLVVYSDGAITLSNIVANLNGGKGVYADNRSSLTKLGVTVIGSNYFNDNGGGDGLVVYSHGAITAANLNASDNGGNGAYLDNCDLNSGQCQISVAKAVTLTGVNTLNNNTLDGLNVLSWGNITLNNLIASNNGGNGAYVDNQWSNNAATPKVSVGTWTLLGYGIFKNNVGSGAGLGEGDGLEGYSYGNMILNNLTAQFNGNDINDNGVKLDTGKPIGSASVTINGVNYFNDNVGDGLNINADGKITVSSILATFNGGYGAYLTNNYDLGMGVTLTGTNSFLYNGNAGLYVDSSGAILLSNITARYNGSYGASLGNLYDPAKPYNVTLTGSNSFTDNGDSGLEAYSFGTILINNLTADENGINNTVGFGYGAYLDNCIWSGTACFALPKTVTLTGSVNVNNNLDSGLYIDSNGAITLNNISADGNSQQGVELHNDTNNLKPQNVTLKGSNTFTNNVVSGLVINSYGAIALNNVTANFNGADGASLDNYNGNGVFAKAITLTGVNSFVENLIDGLRFDTIGAVVLNRINADMNGDTGVEGLADGGITMVCAHTFSNGTYGYNLNTFGAIITIKGIYSAYNPSGDNTNGNPVLTTKPCALP